MGRIIQLWAHYLRNGGCFSELGRSRIAPYRRQDSQNLFVIHGVEQLITRSMHLFVQSRIYRKPFYMSTINLKALTTRVPSSNSGTQILCLTETYMNNDKD